MAATARALAGRRGALAVALALKETALLAVGPILLATFVARTRLGRGMASNRGSSRRKRGAALVLVFPLVAGSLWVVKNLALYGRPLVTYQPFQWGDPLAGALGLSSIRRTACCPSPRWRPWPPPAGRCGRGVGERRRR